MRVIGGSYIGAARCHRRRLWRTVESHISAGTYRAPSLFGRQAGDREREEMDEARARALAAVDPELIGALAAIPDFDDLALDNLAHFRGLMAGSEIALGHSDGIETRSIAFGEDRKSTRLNSSH